MKFLPGKKKIVLPILLVLLSLFAKLVLATPPTSTYTPGETLNPNCSPGDTNCDVESPLTSTNISDTAYDEATWNGVTTIAPSKNAIRDKIEALSLGSGANTALSNLASVAINTTLVSDTDNTDALGTTAIAWSDLFLGSGAVITWNSAPSTADLTLTHTAETLTFAGGTIALGTATATGGLTGNVTGDVTGSAATVTGAAQAAITSLGILTALDVDNINVNLNTISSTAGTDLLITPLAGQQLVLDGAIVIDAGEVTGATSITSTTFVGALTGTASGNLVNVVEDTTPQLGGALDGQGFDLNNMGVLFLTEQAAAEVDVAGKGQLWVETLTPNILRFTDDTGTDFTVAHNATATLNSLTSATSLAWTGMTTGTDGQIPTFDATGNPAFVATGSVGQILTSNGAAPAPTFEDPTGGGNVSNAGTPVD